MRRAERILQLLQAIRRHRRPVTAATLAGELEVSVRTIYRDIVALQATRVPVSGEAGIGYVLDDGYDLPPLMFDADEIEAVILGLRWVSRRGDSDLSRAARNVVAKVGAVLPARLRPLLFDASLLVPPHQKMIPDRIDIAKLRAAIRLGRKVRLRYRSESQALTERTVWPLAVAYFEPTRLLIGWCELRRDFRHFRTDRIETMEVQDHSYPDRRTSLLKRWQDNLRRETASPTLDVLS